MKIYKLLVVFFALFASSLVAMATARNDIWQTAVPMSSSPATTFKSTSTYRNNRPPTTIRYTSPYASSRSGIGNYSTGKYRASSNVGSYKAYKSSSAMTNSYGSYNSGYCDYNNTYRNNAQYRAGSSVSSLSPRVGAPQSQTVVANGNIVYSTRSANHVWRGTEVGETKFEDGQWWIYNGTEWVEMATEPDYEVGDKKYEDGQWWTYNGTEWVPEATEPMPVGNMPIIMFIIMIAGYIALKNKIKPAHTKTKPSTKK